MEVRCSAFYSFFGTPENVVHRAEVREHLGKSKTEIEELFGEPYAEESSAHDPEWAGLIYSFDSCPSGASKAEKEAWILGYHYIVELNFDSGSLRSCAVTWPRVYGLKRGLVK
jgi:hypothetical protein